MPTFGQVRLPTPTDWSEFEDICKSAFSLRWNNPNLTRHGRQGQAQDGVDIYGDDNLGKFVGIQCKNTIANITEKIISDECDKADKFHPPLTALYIATTFSRDTHLQKVARDLSQQRKLLNKFPVDIVFWEDLTTELSKDESAMRQHFPQFFGNNQPSINELMRNKDILNLDILIGNLDFPTLRQGLDYGAKYIEYDLLNQFDSIKNFKQNHPNAFHDPAIEQAIDSLYDDWYELVKLIRQAPYDDMPRHNKLKFTMPRDMCRDVNEENLYEDINQKIHIFITSMNSFASFIKSNYVEVNLK
ncbi:hypothetical protein [Pantoea agglomerans]